MVRCMPKDDLAEAAFWILTALAAGRRHGYAIIADVTTASNGEIRLKPTTLYATLDRLASQALIAGDGDEVVDGRTRRYFVLTQEGRARLAVEVERLSAKAAVARGRLAPGLTPVAGARA